MVFDFFVFVFDSSLDRSLVTFEAMLAVVELTFSMSSVDATALLAASDAVLPCVCCCFSLEIFTGVVLVAERFFLVCLSEADRDDDEEESKFEIML